MPRQQRNPLPSLLRLRELFDYDPESGRLRWRVSKGNAKTGAEAGCLANDGYRVTRVDGTIYLVHRFCYALGKGVSPKTGETVDHINGNRCDNRLSNLRLASYSEQQQNRFVPKPRSRTDSRYLPRGVTRSRDRFRAIITVTIKGKRHKIQQTFLCYLQAGYAAALLRDHYHQDFAQHGVDTPERFNRLIDAPVVRFPKLD